MTRDEAIVNLIVGLVAQVQALSDENEQLRAVIAARQEQPPSASE